MGEKKNPTPAEIKKQNISRISSWLNIQTPIKLKSHIRELLKVSPECYAYFMPIVSEIDNDPDKLLCELRKLMSQSIVSDRKYRHGHNIQPPSYDRIMDFAEKILETGCVKELFDLLLQFGLIIADQATLFDNDGEWYIKGTTVLHWIDGLLRKASVTEDYKIAFRAELLSFDAGDITADCFSNYMERNYTTKQWSIMGDIFLEKILSDKYSYKKNYGRVNQWAVKSLINARRKAEIPAFLKAQAGL
jgi:hypothetical protein